MLVRLNDLKLNYGSVKRRKRVGRGIGSGKGKTAGAGGKGQTARSGVVIHGFEGGQMPLHRRLPKRGFRNPFSKRYAEVNIGVLQKAVEDGRLDPGSVVSSNVLCLAKIIRRAYGGVRLLGKGILTVPLQCEVVGASRAASIAVEKAGGSVSIVSLKS